MTKDWVHRDGQILLQIITRAVITSPCAWTSSAGMSTPADFHYFNDCTAIVEEREGGMQNKKNGEQ